MKATSLITLIDLKYFLKTDNLISLYVLVIYDFGKNIYVRYEENIHFLLEGEGEGVRVGEEL
jgi:hypothetical protein